MFSSELWEIFKNNFLYRTPPMAASEFNNNSAGATFLNVSLVLFN